jgi:hypothetical protein
MASMIADGMFKNVVRFAAAQKTLSGKAAYLIKGLIFALFMSRMASPAAADDSVSSKSQAGDDIYPLF